MARMITDKKLRFIPFLSVIMPEIRGSIAVRRFNPISEIEPRISRKGTDKKELWKRFLNLFGVSLNPNSEIENWFQVI
jgi:hypothetical protein